MEKNKGLIFFSIGVAFTLVVGLIFSAYTMYLTGRKPQTITTETKAEDNLSEEALLMIAAVLAENDIEQTAKVNEQEPKQIGNKASAPSTSDATLGQQNALRSAQNYLRYIPYSYKGLIHQLVEGSDFTIEDATWAADNCGADWNEQAAKSAKHYLEYMSFSKTELRRQLIEGELFTEEEADFGVAAVGY